MRGYMAEVAGHRGDVGSPLGVELSATARTIRVPLLHSVATCDKLLPLATSSGLNFTIYLEDAKNALVQHASAFADYIIVNPRLVFYVTEPSPETEALLQQSVQPIGFNLNFTGLACTTDKKQTSGGALISQLGFRYSSLNKVTRIQRGHPQDGSAPVLRNQAHHPCSPCQGAHVRSGRNRLHIAAQEDFDRVTKSQRIE